MLILRKRKTEIRERAQANEKWTETVKSRDKEQQEWLTNSFEWLVKEQKKQELEAVEQTLESLLARKIALEKSIQSMEVPSSPSPLSSLDFDTCVMSSMEGDHPRTSSAVAPQNRSSQPPGE